MRMQRRQPAPRCAADGARGAISKLRKLPMVCPAGGENVMAVSPDATEIASSAGWMRSGIEAPARSIITAQPQDQSAIPDGHALADARQLRAASTRQTVTRDLRRIASLRA